MNCPVPLLVALLVAGLAVAIAVNKAPGRLGCYEDNAKRVWQQWQNTHEKNNVHFCRNMCQDYKYAGMQGQWCMCGDNVPPKALPDSKCKAVCPGEPGQTCGGPWALEVFPVEPKPAMVGRKIGCFQDAADRIWKTGLIHMVVSNSHQRCFNSCRGFRYAGLEGGAWCMCGDSLPKIPIPESNCQVQCSGYLGKKCGGQWALDVYEISEVPTPVEVVGCVPQDYQPSSGLGIYKLFTHRKTWDEAWQQCEDDDAHLLIVNSEEEAKFVRSLFAQVPSEKQMHAGFHDLLRKGTYRTLFGETLQTAGYNVWSEQHPPKRSPMQHCGCVDASAQLAQIDGNCGAQAVFVCEKKSESPDANGHSQDFDVRGALGSRGQ